MFSFFTAKFFNSRMQSDTTLLFVWFDVYHSKLLINSTIYEIIDALINSWGERLTWFDCDARSTTRNLSDFKFIAVMNTTLGSNEKKAWKGKSRLDPTHDLWDNGEICLLHGNLSVTKVVMKAAFKMVYNLTALLPKSVEQERYSQKISIFFFQLLLLQPCHTDYELCFYCFPGLWTPHLFKN